MLIETVVCSARKGRDARLLRLLESRQAFKKRSEGCRGAWVAPAAGQKGMFLVQSLFLDLAAWKEVNERIKSELDPKDGGIEAELVGPPLVGMFEIDEDQLPFSN